MRIFRLTSIHFLLGLVLWAAGGVPETAWAAFKDVEKNSCIDCHRVLDDPRLRNPVELWGGSVHSAVGNTCDGCHGGDPRDPAESAMSPQKGFLAAPKEDEITSFCGKCHQELADNFKTSEHFKSGTQNCIGCHGRHDIHTISPDIIDEKRCGECHDYEPADRLKTILVNLHGSFRSASARVDQVSGLPTSSVRRDLDKIWKRLRQVRMISHTFDMERVAGEAKLVEASIQETGSEIDRLLEQVEDRKSIGFMAVGLFVLLSVITALYNRAERERPEDGDGSP